MKKVIISSSLALLIGVGGVALSEHETHASENVNVNQTQLANLAQHNTEQLNQHPIQEGKYDIHFTQDGIQYNFTSDGNYWKWNYYPINTSKGFNNEIYQNQTSNTEEQNYNTIQSNVNLAESNQQFSNESVETVSAPENHQTNSAKLANGNTPGANGSWAAQKMEKRTGVSASTWEHIIARESNGQPNAQNPSGASGLFQTMPGWGSTATVQDQVNAAEKAYNNQGMSAWSL